MFPQPIGMAASFDPDRLHEIAKIIAKEARIKHYASDEMEDRGIYKGLTMWTPNINIFRDPRWGRGHETYGEDPFLTARMGVAFIKGLQGDGKVLTCVSTAKHFAAHSGPEADRHEFDVHPSKRDMTLTYLPAFKAAVQEAGVQSVMGAYNRVYGEAACASGFLLLKKLREEWGFDGYVVSDCGAIEDIYEHHRIVSTPEEAAALAVNNGCDLCCGRVFPHLIEAVRQGLIDEETITRSVKRLMRARMKLGMFDPLEGQPYWDASYLENDCAAHHAVSLDMAVKSMVLLKNDGLLPLRRDALGTVAVIGPNADSRNALRGNYYGTPSETWTVLEGLRHAAPGVRFLYAEGCSLTGGSVEKPWGEKDSYRIAEALKCAEIADAVIVVTGLNGDCEGEEGYGSGDRETMLLPASQRMLLDALSAIDKPTVLVNMTGSATVFPHEERMDAILQAWYPGQMGGLAVARVLFADEGPGGRLPVTFYRSMDQVPDMKDYSMQGRTYRYIEDAPAYPFGYGLTYTRFSYEGLSAEAADGEISVRVTVSNTGDVEGREVVQCYVRLEDPEYPAPKHSLCAFRAIDMRPGESRELEMRIPSEQLCVCDDDGDLIRHEGAVTVFVGGGQPDQQIGPKPVSVTVAL